MATKTFSIKVPPSTTEQTVNVAVNIPDPVITVPEIKVTQDKATYTQADITETHTVTGTTAPTTTPPPVTPTPTSTPSPRKNLIVDADFAVGVMPSKTLLNPQSATPDEISISKDTGAYTCKITVNKTDSDVGSNKRSEINRPTSAEPFKNGAVRWYGISYFLPTSYVNDPAPELLFQQHEYSGTASPHFAIWTIAGHWWIAINGIKQYDLGAYATGKWTNFVVYFKWSTGTDGLIEVYMNGLKVKSLPSANMPTDSYLPYLKVGIYKWPWKSGNPASSTTTRTIYIGAIRIGNDLATYADVAP